MSGAVGPCLQLALTATAVPRSFKEARSSPEWDAIWAPAIARELDTLERYGVYKVRPKEDWMRVLRAQWVFARKVDGLTGAPADGKARFVADGGRQIKGIDFDETHASVAHRDSVRTFLALVNHLDLDCDSIDVKAAFLNGGIDEQVFLRPPQGSGIPEGNVIELLKSLYGLKQANRNWREEFHAFLCSQGLIPTTADPCIYRRDRDGILLLVSTHVDDEMIACSSRSALDAFKADIRAKYEIKDNGPLSYFLGISIHRDRTTRRLFISLPFYVHALLSKFGMTDCNPASTPLPSGFRNSTASDADVAEAKTKPFPSLVGGLLYLATVGRPDIAFAANSLACALSRWGPQHWSAAKHVLRYLAGTADLALVYSALGHDRSPAPALTGSADADWHGCPVSFRSTTGYAFSSFGGTVSWCSRRQKTVALSTAEAEFMAASDAAKQALFLRHLLDDLGFLPSAPTLLACDNQSTVALSRNPTDHSHQKHIDLRIYRLRELVQDGLVSLYHVPSADNASDLFTKNLTAVPFARARALLGMERYTAQGGREQAVPAPM